MNSGPFYKPFVQLVGSLLLVAVALRLTWEVLAPVVMPMSIVVLAFVALAIFSRWR